jgi:hypothetical protein
MSYRTLAVATAMLCASCATLNDSIKLGSGMGAVAGLGATFAGYSAAGQSPNLETAALGAGIGIGLGALTAYFTHKSVEEDRQSCLADQTELHFGDLPPSPFVIPRKPTKKGGK